LTRCFRDYCEQNKKSKASVWSLLGLRLR